MSTIFSRIIAGEIPCFKIEEDENFLAFLDVNPLVKGHTLVIPKVEIDYIFDVEDEMLAQMIVFSKKVARKLQSKIPCKRIGVSVIGLEVPHAHIHLIPINSISDMTFDKPKMKLEFSELKQIQDLIVNS
jgi:histidine triad (HIT) family protein